MSRLDYAAVRWSGSRTQKTRKRLSCETCASFSPASALWLNVKNAGLRSCFTHCVYSCGAHLLTETWPLLELDQCGPWLVVLGLVGGHPVSFALGVPGASRRAALGWE